MDPLPAAQRDRQFAINPMSFLILDDPIRRAETTLR
jgi:hypothetical protein